MNPNASIDSDSDSNFIGPFYTRREAAEYVADPRNNGVNYFDADEINPESHVQIAQKGTANWENVTRRQLVSRAVRAKEGFVSNSFGDFIRIVELEKRK
jgi:hypothetical protein